MFGNAVSQLVNFVAVDTELTSDQVSSLFTKVRSDESSLECLSLPRSAIMKLPLTWFLNGEFEETIAKIPSFRMT